MAWCNDCDKIYESDGGWNEKNDSNFKVVCDLCFQSLKESQHET